MTNEEALPEIMAAEFFHRNFLEITETNYKNVIDYHARRAEAFGVAAEALRRCIKIDQGAEHGGER